MDNFDTSWYIHSDYWYYFHCIYVSIALKHSGSGIPPLSADLIPQSLQHAIVDDDVEVAPIYRSRGMVEEPRRPHKNHYLHTE